MEISSDHYDFKGLGELRARADSRSEESAREAGKQFEAMFFKMMLKSMREASEPLKSGLFDSAAMDNYTEMFDAQVSQAMAQRGSLGVADWLVQHLNTVGAIRSNGLDD